MVVQGKDFAVQQIRIRSDAYSSPYTLASVIAILARMLHTKYNKSIEELRSWRLDKISKVPKKKATFICHFEDDDDMREPLCPPIIYSQPISPSVSISSFSDPYDADDTKGENRRPLTVPERPHSQSS